MTTCSSINDSTGLCNTLESSGVGFGSFLNAIASPLVYIIIALVIVGAIAMFIMAVAEGVKSKLHFK